VILPGLALRSHLQRLAPVTPDFQPARAKFGCPSALESRRLYILPRQGYS